MLTLDQITVTRGNRKIVADLQLEPGALLGVIGPSGAGKSTLLHAIAGIEPLTSGRVLWQGRDLAGVGPGRRPMTLMFQNHNLFPHLTVFQNLGLGINPDLHLTGDEVEKIHAVLGRMGLADLQGRKSGALSGGQIARAGLARALLRSRPILMLDEPFGGLGPALRREMLDLVAEVAAETAAMVLMVSHDPADVLRFAGQTIVVAKDRAFAPVDTRQLLSDPPAVLKDYLG